MSSKSFSEYNILIVDDAPIVVLTLRNMLTKLGFSDKRIFTARLARGAISIAHKEHIDLIICDYNFGRGMNGKQLFEELKHLKLLNHDTVFILVTGESSATIVRAIIELKPDEYLLKPFNSITLRERISAAIKRKVTLRALYEAELKNDARSGLEACDELAPFNPEYFFIIEKFRADFLTRLKLHQEAKHVYERVIERKDVNWAKIGLANTMVALGETDEAKRMVLTLLEESPNNVEVRECAANYTMLNREVPSAIKHLDLASSLVEGYSERELVIVNLCLAEHDYHSALMHYHAYMEINKDTYRNNTYAKLNLIRILLYCTRKLEGREDLLAQAKTLFKSVMTGPENKALKNELDLIAAHIAIEENQYVAAFKVLSDLYHRKPFTHFYAQFHLAWLLHEMNFESEFTHAITWCFENLQTDSSDTILSSKITLGRSLEADNVERQAWMQEQYKKIRAAEQDYQSLIDALIELQAHCPLLRTVCINIIKVLTRAWPTNKNALQVEILIKKCDNIVKQLVSGEELERSGYDKFLFLAQDRCQQMSVVNTPPSQPKLTN
ncbi:tetratricopeptide repeat-containing response regulator [Vibrio jasicida]|uniref:tetratricopeptide repeat-containing response regulator n=1 Tax=Vibrio jasicida TaxID=766224 RepID=UPI0005EF867E|nr:tetratricopeptide repeat-containing response regulator [Vibrio jasicida]